MIGLWAFVAYICVIILWNVVIKRGIGEAMVIGFVVVAVFGGAQAPGLMWAGIRAAATEEVVFAASAFVFMGFLLGRTGLVDRLVDMLNSLLGRLRGGPAYVSTVASALFGTISGSGSGNAAAVGSITIPWMMRANIDPRLAATVVAGNAGLGIAFPPSSSLFILTGLGAVSSLVSAEALFLSLFAGGAWLLLYRLVLMWALVRRYGIGPVDPGLTQPLRRTFAAGWPSLLIFLGIAVPVVLTTGAVAAWLDAWAGAGTMEAVSIITWIPVLVILVTLVVGRRSLPRGPRGWWDLLGEAGPKYGVIGVVLFFAFAASTVLGELGMGEELTSLLSAIDAPAFVLALIVGVIVLAAAAPLTSTATMVAVGSVAFTALVGAGVSPTVAAVAVLMFASTEGASPPGAAPIYIASGIAGVDPTRTFLPLLLWYVLPTLLITTLVAVGFLPIPG
ncbi:TRAP-type C4-dicarboxylate transport system permease large subunit [Streptomonospora nanhaiensis]|uniref:TRAP-type C4-dicarboxylate transport system permease large subunit n=1 Tax=Streptomonospora nanhaiensis TaxID=1323731 RepID=A0A853BUM9_9ACTN|nr:TRAP-type C4-dicarboxylate transport system permease large subunit [Streptomonospora nanhaiensis]